MQSKRLHDAIGGVALAAVVIACLLFLLAPIAVTVILSFDARRFLGPFPPSEFSLDWYRSLASDLYFLDGFKTSLAVGLIASAIATAIGAVVAMGLYVHDGRGRKFFEAVFLSPLVIPGVVIGFAMLFAFSRIGLVDGFARLIAGHIVLTIPYTMRTTLASLSRTPRSLYESALILGARENRALFDVIAPQARTGIAAGFVVALAVSFDDVAISAFLGTPDAYTLPVALTSMLKGNFSLDVAAASVLLLAGALFILLLVDRLVGVEALVGVRGRDR